MLPLLNHQPTSSVPVYSTSFLLNTGEHSRSCNTTLQSAPSLAITLRSEAFPVFVPLCCIVTIFFTDPSTAKPLQVVLYLPSSSFLPAFFGNLLWSPPSVSPLLHGEELNMAVSMTLLLDVLLLMPCFSPLPDPPFVAALARQPRAQPWTTSLLHLHSRGDPSHSCLQPLHSADGHTETLALELQLHMPNMHIHLKLDIWQHICVYPTHMYIIQIYRHICKFNTYSSQTSIYLTDIIPKH